MDRQSIIFIAYYRQVYTVLLYCTIYNVLNYTEPYMLNYRANMPIGTPLIKSFIHTNAATPLSNY